MMRNEQRAAMSSAMTRVLVLLFVVCLAESATEQRINSRGSKSTNLIQKINGWRSQRGGSCLSYGHSCWGAHGKRSGKLPASAPDWFITRMLRRMAMTPERNVRQAPMVDLNDIFSVNPASNTNDRPLYEDSPEYQLDSSINRLPEAKPMLDDDILAKMRLLKVMRQTSAEEE